MIKRVVAVLFTLFFALNVTACNQGDTAQQTANGQKDVFKIGVILTGNNNDGSSYAHVQAIKQAAKELSISEDQIVWKYSVRADDKSYDTAKELVENGCDVVISNNRNYQEYMQQAAKDNPDADFVVIGGDTAKDSGLSNLHNAYTSIYQARYLTGIVAGLKLNELMREGKLTPDNYDNEYKIKIGYVGTLPGSEATSSYTAFYLGVKSVCEDVSMSVQYSNKRSDFEAEKSTASQLIEQGCVLVVQHSKQSGVCDAVITANSEGTLCYCVGFDAEINDENKDYMLVSVETDWSDYYHDALGLSMKNEKFDSDWVAGLEEGAVGISKLSDCCSEDAQTIIDEKMKEIISEEIDVFSTETFSVNGKPVKSAYATDTDGDDVPDEDQAIFDSAFHESYFRSAPYFSLDIDGITVLN